MSDTNERVVLAANKLSKWKAVFSGWQLGTRSSQDPESNAVRDHRETTMLLRAETSGIVRLLVEKGLVTVEELETVIADEYEALDNDYEERFPGFKATQEGLVIDARAAETTKGWKP